jgi:hypothetical protein
MQLKSSFSIRIYELLKQYENFKERSFLVEDLRTMLGIEADEYPKYGNFKQKVLNVAQKEIAEKTDISFEYEETKVGRGVGKIRFFITTQKKAKKTLPLADAIEISRTGEKIQKPEVALMLRLLDLIPQEFRKESVKKLIRSTLEKHGFDHVVRNIVYTNEKSNAMKPGSNPEKGSNYRIYLSKALHWDYGLAYQEDREAKKEREEKRQHSSKETNQKKEAERAAILTEQENREKARIHLKSLPSDTVKALEEKAKSRMSSSSQARLARKDTIGTFEFKLKLEEVVMEMMGLRKPPAPTEN